MTENISKIRKTFIISTVVIIAGYVAGGVLTDLFGNWALVEVLKKILIKHLNGLNMRLKMAMKTQEII